MAAPFSLSVGSLRPDLLVARARHGGFWAQWKGRRRWQCEDQRLNCCLAKGSLPLIVCSLRPSLLVARARGLWAEWKGRRRWQWEDHLLFSKGVSRLATVTVARRCYRLVKALDLVETSESIPDVDVTMTSLSLGLSLSKSLCPERADSESTTDSADQSSKHQQSESENKKKDEFSFLKGPRETRILQTQTRRP